MHSVALIVTDGISLFEVAAPVEVFGVRRPELADPWYDFHVHGPADARLGGVFHAEKPEPIDAIVDADTVVVPACCDAAADQPDDVVDAVRAAHDRGARIVSICTGAFVLAAAGLLDGRRATTHWLHAELLARRYPQVSVDPGCLYTDDGSVLTSAGKTAGMDLCLHVVRLDHGAAVANALARRLVAPPHRDGGQAQFIPSPGIEGQDHTLASLLTWVTANLGESLGLDDLARESNMSVRSLNRHFQLRFGISPLQWLLTQRVARAQELLETTVDSVEQVAERTGMGTAASLRRHFNRRLGVSPDAYRRTFRAHGEVALVPAGAPSGPAEGGDRRAPSSTVISVSKASEATRSSSVAGARNRSAAARGYGAAKPT